MIKSQQIIFKGEETCNDLAMSGNTVIAAITNTILIFQLKDLVWNKRQQLTNGHQEYVIQLQFFSNGEKFITGDNEGQLCIWVIFNYQWHFQSKINQNYNMHCFILLRSENEIITGGCNGATEIQIWIQRGDWVQSEIVQTKQFDAQYVDLSIDENETLLVLLEVTSNYIALISMYQKKQKWIKKQRIITPSYGKCICLVGQQITYHSCIGDLQLYQIDHYNQLFQKYHFSINSQTNQPHFFNFNHYRMRCKFKKFFNQVSNTIDILKVNQNNQISIEYSISFESDEIICCLSDDGNHFVSWDGKSRNISIIKLE